MAERRWSAAGSRTNTASAGRSRRPSLLEYVTDKDPERAKRAMQAMMTMKKIDIAAIEKAVG